MVKVKKIHLGKTSLFTYCGQPRGQVLDTYELKRVTCASCQTAHARQS